MNKNNQYETILQLINDMQLNLDELFMHIDGYQTTGLKVDVATVNLSRANIYVKSATEALKPLED